MTRHSNQVRVCFIVESGTDVRLVEGLAERVALRVLARDIAKAYYESRERLGFPMLKKEPQPA